MISIRGFGSGQMIITMGYGPSIVSLKGLSFVINPAMSDMERTHGIQSLSRVRGMVSSTRAKTSVSLTRRKTIASL